MMAVDSFDAIISSDSDAYAWAMSDSGTVTESCYVATDSPPTNDYTVMPYSDPSSVSPLGYEPRTDSASGSSPSELNYWETPEYLAIMAAMSADAQAEAQRQAEEQARQEAEMQAQYAQMEAYFRDLAAQEVAQAQLGQSTDTTSYSDSGASSTNASSGSSDSSSPEWSCGGSSRDTSSSSNSTGTSSPIDPSPPPAVASGSSSGSSDSAGGSSWSATEDATAAAGATTTFAATPDEPGSSGESQQAEKGNPGGDPFETTEDNLGFAPPELQAATVDQQPAEGEQVSASDVIELPAEPSAVEEAECLAAQEAFLAKELESRRIAQERRNEAAKQREAIEKAKSQYDMNHWQLPHWWPERCDIYVRGFINDNQGLMATLPGQQSVRFEQKVADPNSQVTGHAVLGFKLADGEWMFIDDNSWGGVFGKDDVPAGWMCRALGINCEPPPPRPRPDKDPADVLFETLGPPR